MCNAPGGYLHQLFSGDTSLENGCHLHQIPGELLHFSFWADLPFRQLYIIPGMISGRGEGTTTEAGSRMPGRFAGSIWV